MTSGVGLENKLDLVPHAPKNGEDFLLRARGVGRVVEAPVISIHLARKHRTSLVRIAANGDDRIDILIEKFIHVL